MADETLAWLAPPPNNRVIWKYPLAPWTVLQLPKGAQVVHVAAQHDDVVMWAAVDPDAREVHREFRVVATGEDFGEHTPVHYWGTAHLSNGLVFHVLEVTGG